MMTTTERERVSGPPKGFRPHMGLKAKLEACLLMLGLPLDVEWDHDPALQRRRWDPDANGGKGDTVPAANDPAFITPRVKSDHKVKTHKQDRPEIRKTRQLERARQAKEDAEAAGAAVRAKMNSRRKIPGPTREQRQAAYQAKKAWAEKMKAERKEKA